jgi:multidrug efflux pump
MNITTYFLKHPVVALILNTMIVIIGILSFNSLSVREYPEVHFPKVHIQTHYPNASAEVVENTVTNPLEDRLAGIEGIDTITSDSKYGASHIYLTFQNGISIDKSLIAIREAMGLANLPREVKPPVVERKTASDGMPFMIISLESYLMDFAELTHYANLNLKNIFRGIKGVASAEVWGQPYTYNILLDARKMYAFGINADDVFNALQKGNLSLPVGKFQNKISVTLNSDLKTIKDYEELIVKEKKSLQPPVLLKQIADIKLQTDDNRFRIRINGKPGLCIAIQQANDANLLEVSTLVHNQLRDVKQTLSHDLKMDIIQDKADFVRHSLKNVKSSIFEAIIFVLIIIFLFLRNFKATIIPLVTIPISLIGSFIFLKCFGFSINIITILAMVLAIGLVVDDAIIVLENIQRHIDKGLLPFNAAIKGAKEIGFAIVAMTLTLTSVYAPLAFIKGTIGELFIEFAVALAGSVLVSGVVALTLSPYMCAKFLQNNHNPLFPKIDEFLDRFTAYYDNVLRGFLLYKKSCLLVFLVAFGLIFTLSQIIPSETAPKEDRNLIGIYVPPIPGKDINTMEQKIELIENNIKPIPEAEHSLVFMGDWGGNILLPLKPQSSRTRSAQEVIDSLKPFVTKIPSLDVHPWSWHSGLPGVNDSANNGELSLVISTAESYSNLFDAVEKVRKTLDDQKVFKNIKHDLKLNTPSYIIDADTNAMAHLNISYKQIAKTIEVFFSGDQSLTFSKDGLFYTITLKGKQSPWDLNELYVTNESGKRISLGVVAKMIPTSGAETLYHYNQMRSVVLTADLPKGEYFDNSMKTFFTEVSKDLPSAYKKTWSGNAKTFGESKKIMITLFFLAIIFIFAILAVQFENFIDPCIILLTVPLACLGALILVWISNGSINIFTQIGLITLIGLITKHGILIVEFSNQLEKELTLNEAIIQASSLRLRPILMTTGCMIFGAIPLMLSNDAGHEAQRAIGIVLVGGLSFGTLFTLFMLPTVCFMIKSFCSSFVKSRNSYK